MLADPDGYVWAVGVADITIVARSQVAIHQELNCELLDSPPIRDIFSAFDLRG